MISPLIQIGLTRLYGGALNSEYDLYTNAALDAMTAEEMAGIKDYRILVGESLAIDHNTDGRSTCSFVVRDDAGTYAFYEREQVLITDLDMIKSFGGVLQSDEVTRIPANVMRFHSISATDYTAILDWRVVDYSANDKLAGDAVREMMIEYLTEEGVTEGYIEGGELLTEISIGNKSIGEGFAKLAEACPGFTCYLDYDLKLYFHSRDLYAAAWNCIDESDMLSESLNITHGNPDFRTTEIVIGGYEETALQIEPFATDGVSKTVTVGYPVNRVSTITLDGVPLSIGVLGHDSGSSYDCYYASKSQVITFQDVPLAGVGEIQYYGLWRSKSKAEDLTLIASNATRQGWGSGKVEHITIDESLNSIIAAGEYANGKLAEYGVDGITVTYKTRRAGLAAGTLQHIAVQDIDEDFLIAHISEELINGDTEYTVTAYYGPVTDLWDLWFRKSFTAIYEIREGVDESVGVTKLFNISHTFLTADRPNPFTTSYPGVLVSSDTWPCFEPTQRTVYLEFWYGGVPIFRKQHTSAPDITNDTLFHSYSFISPAEAVGQIAEVVLFGGDSATLVYGTGVELYRANFNKTKTVLESFQINSSYVNNN